MATAVKIAVAVGELIDKITILQIKKEKIADIEKQKNITHELGELLRSRGLLVEKPSLAELEKQLKQVNEKLWGIEDEIRNCEFRKSFDEDFIQYARSVYITNDQRCQIKRQINMLYDSEIVEEKSYQSY